MTDHDSTSYARHVARDFDEVYEGVFDTEGAVERLLELANGPILEFGVGTGRLAIPLAARGATVCGVDSSSEMLAILAAKEGGRRVSTRLGDFRSVRVPGTFGVVAMVFNTIFGLPDQAAQVATVRNAADHLAHGGRLVVEAWVPDAPRGDDPTLTPRRLADGLVGLVVASNDRARQVLTTTQVVLGGPAGVRIYPLVHRYVHPAELDLMARLAGLELEHRWADWRRTAFTAASPEHISVYRRT